MAIRIRRFLVCSVLAWCVPLLFAAAPVYAEVMGADELIDLPLEDLMQMDATVVSASKRDEPLKDTAAAVYVISGEDIHRSGVTNIPDALRMAPGVQVSRLSTTEWAVSTRGLNGRFARYLLVLIDGRSIYTSLFSGVNWDEQNLSLENIERIEVVRGPGGVMWGANAVNGVVNIITRNPEQRSGAEVRVTAGDGTEKSSVYGRADFGIKGSRAFVAAHAHETAAFEPVDAQSYSGNMRDYRFDIGWEAQHDQGGHGFKAGYWKVDGETLWGTFPVVPPYHQTIYSDDDKHGVYAVLNGALKSAQGEWSWRVSGDDATRRTTAYDWDTTNADIDVRWLSDWQGRHHLTAGLSFRYTDSLLEVPAEGLDLVIEPARESSRIYSAYVQDSVELSPQWQMILGMRLDDHSITSTSVQPSVRLLWQPHSAHRIWGGISQANSTPSRVINSQSELAIQSAPPSGAIPLPQKYVLSSDGSVVRDVRLTAYELGYRFLPRERFSIDIATFYHGYDYLLGATEFGEPELRQEGLIPYLLIPAFSESAEERTNWGAEASVLYHATDRWLFQYSGSYINFDFSDFGTFIFSDSVPSSQHSFRSLSEFGNGVSLDLWLRYTASLERTHIPSYWSLDVSAGYAINSQLHASLHIKNLIDDQRIEGGREILEAVDSYVESFAFVKLEWNFAK